MKAYLIFLLPLILMNMTNVKADKWVYGAAYQFETGDFSQPQDTDIVTVPIYLNYYTEQWGFGIEVPYVSVSGSSDIIPSSNGQSSGHGKKQSTSSAYTRAGIGDISIFLSYAFPSNDTDRIFYELSTAVKLATADETENLGTGENDYSVKLNISSKSSDWSPSASVGYQVTGDNASSDLNNVYFYSLGSGYQLSEKSSIAMNYHFKQALSDDSEDSSSIGFNYAYMINRYYDLGMGLSAGLSDDNPDFGVNIFFTGYY